ncbi:uncharacterized protein GGS22DRAFT_168573 [Annulohypoxylon maeteangense]|uniref:uncharacterized protein n=1 Tax=Annulohypoxylon maeteangense TaxID=1927788 RepID=UPI002007B3B1|nr:uncharacterized protein GGS22DRAFT_168573 [Annulohypoxylon maeteangense]KAI0882719.1 hypothetical protein GGS22DRAFT_168573 [Annulohypoxylon maeteangense]
MCGLIERCRWGCRLHLLPFLPFSPPLVLLFCDLPHKRHPSTIRYTYLPTWVLGRYPPHRCTIHAVRDAASV